MKFLIDENFPRSARDLIIASGHKALLLSELCERGVDDETVFNVAQNEGAK